MLYDRVEHLLPTFLESNNVAPIGICADVQEKNTVINVSHERGRKIRMTECSHIRGRK